MRGDGDDLAPDVALAGGRARFDPSGALWLAEHRTLVVSDLHLEKGSSYGLRGQMLPPYDSRATLERLGAVIARYAPDRVISLGDSFHDAGAAARIDAQDADTLMDLIRPIADWVWIEGNHDPAPPARFGGRRAGELGLGGLTFRHEPSAGPAPGEAAGHLHPVARIRRRGRAVRRRCFLCDGARVILPAFGAYAGGLNVRDPAFAGMFERPHAWMLGRDRVWPIPPKHWVPD